jgi:dTDP-4-amino-4,6-dideoxygalactose transaminase
VPNPYAVVHDFEKAVAEFAGCKYGVAVDSCTNALFLCCKYLKVLSVLLPSKTYPSVPCSVIQAGGSVKFIDLDWRDAKQYQLIPYPIFDAAHLFEKDMYKYGFMCISFSATKTINIGKGGMILTNDAVAVDWFKQARYCGRHELALLSDHFEMLGWNMYMTPEQAARGLLLMNNRNGFTPPPLPEYPDLSKFEIYTNPNSQRAGRCY